MALVAIAGGTSPTLGRSITTAILRSGKHSPVILSRSKAGSDDSAPTSKYGALIHYVDYDSVESLTKALEGVHTVISVLLCQDSSQMLSFHFNLIEAAEKAGCKRFVPSAWDGGPQSKEQVDLLRNKLDIWERCTESKLECAEFLPGWFMNFFGHGCPVEKREEAYAGLVDDFLLEFINMAEGKITVPVTKGGKPGRISMTEIGDIGHFVVAALDLKEGEWGAEMGMMGSTVDLAEVAKLAEKVTGRNFDVTKITKEELQQREEELNLQLAQEFSVKNLVAKLAVQLMKCTCEDMVGNQIVVPVLNKLCPQVQPVGIEEYLEHFWSTK
jgi:uncharacterized protein YbjT (DUF2867 family)